MAAAPDNMSSQMRTLSHTGDSTLSGSGTTLLTLTITEDGEVQAHPGINFTPDHMDLLIEATGAVQDVFAGQTQSV